MTVIATGWAVVRADGSVIADFAHDIDEPTIWKFATGYGIVEDIAYAKSRGARAFRCELHEINDNTTDGVK